MICLLGLGISHQLSTRDQKYLYPAVMDFQHFLDQNSSNSEKECMQEPKREHKRLPKEALKISEILFPKKKYEKQTEKAKVQEEAARVTGFGG